MKSIVIYSSASCPYCIKAKALFESKDVSFQELRVDQNPALADEAKKKSGGRMTVPQIFIDDYHVGGCDELYALDRAGKLDPMITEAMPGKSK